MTTSKKTKTAKKTASTKRVRPFPLKVLVIDREHWGKYALLNKDGTKCCLGYAAEACGVPAKALAHFDDEGIGEVSRPFDMSDAQQAKMPSWLRSEYDNGKDHVSILADTNDGDAQEKAQRVIKRIFAKHGVKVFFVDKEGDVPPELAKSKKQKKTIGRKRQVAKR